jgi:hypothetical protein
VPTHGRNGTAATQAHKKENVMARLTSGQKIHAAVQLLIALPDPGIHAALAPHGLTEAVLDDGWGRLRMVTHLPRPVGLSTNPDIVKRVDALENRWFPMARYSLQFRYPDMARKLFDGLSQVSGAAALVSADLFVSRIEQMAAGVEPFGEQGPEARAALRERGLTDEVLGEIRSLLAEVRTFPAGTVRMPDSEGRKAALDALWAWYREWAGVARIAVKNRTHLRMLGLRRSRRGGGAVHVGLEPARITVGMPAQPAGPAPGLNAAATGPGSSMARSLARGRVAA